jgi:hypothetical protein
MPENLKIKLKDRMRLSDKQLDTAIRWSKRLSVVSTSGAGVWGGVAIVGSAALLLNAAGAGIPAIIGVSTVVTGSLLALKAIAVRSLYKLIHRKSVKAKETRTREREAKATALAPSVTQGFNNEASPQQDNALPKPASPALPAPLSLPSA